MNDSRADKPKAAEETEDIIKSARFHATERRF